MAKISFYLTNPSAKNETPLFCFINYGLFENGKNNGKKKYLPLKYYTTISIHPDLWRKDINRAKESIKWANPETFDISVQAVKESAKKNYDKINSDIENFERTAKDLLNTITIDGILPSHDLFRNELDKIFKPSKDNSTTSDIPKELFQFIDYLIETSPNKESTLKSFKVVRKNLFDYQKAKNKKLTFQNIDIDFYNSFVDYLTKLPLAKNTVGTRIKILKTFLNQAYDQNITVNTDYKKKSFKKPSEPTESIYLTETELMQMYNLETSPECLEMLKKYFNTDKLPLHLAKIRDIFLIGCYTGLRFSDLSRLSKDNITENNTIKIKTIKTNQFIVVPIQPIVRQIFEKYEYKLPHIPSNQPFNRYLKQVAQLAQINEKINIEHTKGGFRVSETTEKYNLVTSHTARRSAATNMFMADVPSISIMKITGHKTESAFMKYIKISADDNANKLKSHKFFNKMIIAK